MKKEIKKFSIKKEYTKSWKYLKESQKFIWAVIILFFLTALIGFFVKTPEIVSIEILELIKELLEKTQGMPQGELIGFIFLNNLLSSFWGIISGFFLGIFPLISTIANGYVLGFVSKLAVSANGFTSLLRLLPHGIFELPAIFISFGLGLKFGNEFIKKYFNIKNQKVRIVIIILSLLISIALILFLYSKPVLLGAIQFLILLLTFIFVFSRKVLITELLNGARVFLTIVIPLLIIAGIIEGSLIFFS